MESVGEFEFNRKDLIGHGSFAVVFKGRHKEKPDMEVAVKCISKKNLAKSQSLLDKEIGILKELQHDNIVRLLDCQKQRGCVYLIMEYCNGGDLAEYLHTQGSLSEDTIRIFLQQIAKAMKVLQSKGIIHRDLKPQNILLCHRKGRRSRPKNMCIKIADFGFARHLQTNMMAATLCGSPLYMAPEVIMSQHYDAKADLWSIGTIVYQCLTGEAPFHALTPQKLRMFYESSSNLLPRIPRETSRELKNLLRKLLQKNQKDRISFEEFFQHPFLETISPTKKYSPVPAYQFPSSASGDSSSSSHTSSLAFPQHSDGDLNQQPKGSPSPAQDTPVSSHGMNHMAYSHSGDAESFSDEYVILHVPCSRENTCEVEATSHNTGSQMYSRCLPLAEKSADTAEKTPPPSPLLHTPSKPESNKPVEFVGRNWSEAVPIPVPTQIQNYQHIEQNLQSVSLQSPTRASPCCASSPRCGRCRALRLPFNSPRLTTGGARPQRSSPTVGISPKTLEQTILLGTKTGQLADSPDMLDLSRPQVQSRPPNRTRTTSDLQSLVPFRSPQHNLRRDTANKKGPFKRSLSTGMLSNMLRKAAFGAQLFEKGSDESLNSEKSMDTAAPPTGCHRSFQLSPSPPPVVFTMGSPSNLDPYLLLSGSPSYINSPGILGCRLLQCGSRRNSETEAMGAFPNSGLVFHPPELPEDTVMEQAHTTGLTELRFTLAFVHCIMELASSKDQGACVVSSPDVSLLEQSLVTDQISLLNREWSYTEQLVLYMRAEECLSSALRTAKDSIKQGQLFPSDTVKREIRELNELYKKCVTHCRSLNHQLQTFLLNKQRLMDRFMGITAEKLLYSHAVHMVQSAALDEMFHNDTTSVHRYHKALLLMEGLSRIITEEKDVESIDKCKQSIEQRLAALQTST